MKENRKHRVESTYIQSPDFDKRTQIIQWNKDNLFNKCWWQSWIHLHRRMKLEPYISPHRKINSRWTKEVNLKPETTKLLEEKYRGST